MPSKCSPKLVAAYIRVSTDEQAEQNISIPAQKSRIAAYCLSKDWDIYDYYIDDGYSGKDLNRPEMQRLIADAQNKNFDIVVTWKLDRISRRQKHMMYFIEDILCIDPEAKTSKLDLASVTENIDTSTPMGRAMIGIMAVFAQLERETIIERVRMGKEEAARQGRFHGGKILFGYRHNQTTKGLEIDETEAAIVRFVFEEYCKGDRGYRYITDLLNQNNIVSLGDSADWYKEAVRRIICNPYYAGYSQHNGNLYKGKHQAIISKEVWDKAQEIAKSSRSRFAPENERSTSCLLKGILYCGECNNKVRAKPGGGSKYPKTYYVCYSKESHITTTLYNDKCTNGNHRHELIDQKVVDKLFLYSSNKKVLKQGISEELSQTNTKNHEKIISNLTKELADTRRRIRKWQDEYEDDDISREEMRERTRELQQRRQTIEKQISTCRAELQQVNDNTMAIDNLLDTMSHFPTLWEKSTFEERRQLLLEIVEKVIVFKNGEVKLVFFSA